MSVMDRFLSEMKFNDEDDADDGFYDSGSDDDFQDKPPARKPAAVAERRNTASDEEDFDVSEKEQNPLRKITQKVTPINKPQPRRTSSMGNADVLSIMPKTYEDSRIITDTLLENKAVILNLEGLDFDLAQRIIEFSSGSCYALGGNLQWISKSILIIAPQNINISGDFQSLVEPGIQGSDLSSSTLGKTF